MPNFYTQQLISWVLSGMAWAHECVGQMSLLQICLFAFVARFSAAHIANEQVRSKAATIGALACPLYFLQEFKFSDDFARLISTFIRSYCCYHITTSLASVAISLVSAIRTRCRQLRRSAQSQIQKVADELRASREDRKRKRSARDRARVPVRPPPTLDERLQSFAKQARAEYDAEVRMLKTLPLDRDEFEVLEIQAKRRLLQKLRARS